MKVIEDERKQFHMKRKSCQRQEKLAPKEREKIVTQKQAGSYEMKTLDVDRYPT